MINHKLFNFKKNWVLIICFYLISSTNINAQRGVKIGYIDTEYILQNLSDFQDANRQLDNKAQKWKAEIDKRKADLETKKQQLNNERVLLTADLIDEREEELEIIENELLEYQQKRFGPNGDLVIQKKQLTQPIQDQIFTAIQEIAESKKFDFIFDKSADVVMLYSSNRYNVSEQILKTIDRTNKRNQIKNKKERRELDEEDNIVKIDNSQDERQKLIDERNAKREKELAERKAELEAKREARRRENDNRKQKKENNYVNDDEDSKKETSNTSLDDTLKNDDEDSKKETSNTSLDDTSKNDDDKKNTETPKLSDRELRKKALEEKKKRILAERKERIEALKRKRDSIRNHRNNF